MDDGSEALLIQAMEKFGFSTRTYFKLIKVSRTIADLKGNENICVDDIAEAVQYRSRIFL